MGLFIVLSVVSSVSVGLDVGLGAFLIVVGHIFVEIIEEMLDFTGLRL